MELLLPEEGALQISLGGRETRLEPGEEEMVPIGCEQLVKLLLLSVTLNRPARHAISP